MPVKRDSMTNVRITKKHAAKLDKIAANSGVSRTVLMRWIIDGIEPSTMRPGLITRTVQPVEQHAEKVPQ